MRSHARAAMLVTALNVEPQPIDPFALRVQPVRRIVPSTGGPLNLDAAIFRYRPDGMVIDLPAGARFCTSHAVRDRRRR